MNEFKEIEILLVEDNPGDVDLILMAFKESRLNNSINTMSDGQEALDYVFKRGKYANRSMPDIILLDINLPKVNGIEVLRLIKEDEIYRRIPVIILTTSDADRDIVEAYNQHANAYLNKPIDFNAFIDVVKSIESFWFTVVKLPKKE